jgi:hypothetical protein
MMHNNSNEHLIAVLEPVRELLHDVEHLRYIERSMTILGERVSEARLSVDREIEHLKNHAAISQVIAPVFRCQPFAIL